MQPVNLLTHFGFKYRIERDCSLDTPGQTPADKAWLYTIPCEIGGKSDAGEQAHVFSFGDSTGPRALAYVCFDPKTKRSLANMGVCLFVSGDDEAIFVFPLASFAEVACVVRPCRASEQAQQPAQNAVYGDKPAKAWSSKGAAIEAVTNE